MIVEVKKSGVEGEIEWLWTVFRKSMMQRVGNKLNLSELLKALEWFDRTISIEE